jgi:hypothetical protein
MVSVHEKIQILNATISVPFKSTVTDHIPNHSTATPMYQLSPLHMHTLLPPASPYQPAIQVETSNTNSSGHTAHEPFLNHPRTSVTPTSPSTQKLVHTLVLRQEPVPRSICPSWRGDRSRYPVHSLHHRVWDVPRHIALFRHAARLEISIYAY